MSNQNNKNHQQGIVPPRATFNVLCLLATILLLTFIGTNLLPITVEAAPMDIYDEVSDFFDAMTLDDVPISARSAPETFCRMPIRKGVCRALIPRFSYDPSRKTCVEFKFGGCDGNENNFSTYEACMEMCKGM